MIFIFCGFILGCFIPYIARRFAKFMPATPAYALFRIFISGKKTKRTNSKYQGLLKDYYMRSFGFGVVSAALSGLVYWHFSTPVWAMVYVFILMMLLEIDRKMMLLPDVLTIPLLLLGLCFSLYTAAWITIDESVIGAVVGYLLPVFASAFLVWKYPDAFGGGDIKLLSALGAWLGGECVVYVILIACALFTIKAIILKKREGAFGPELAISAIGVAFVCF